MLSRHWRLWLSFPSLVLLPKGGGRLGWLLLLLWFRLKGERDPPKERTSLFPDALREGARGRGGSQKSPFLAYIFDFPSCIHQENALYCSQMFVRYGQIVKNG